MYEAENKPALKRLHEVSRKCYENGTGVPKMINKNSKNKNNGKACLYDQRINKNIPTALASKEDKQVNKPQNNTARTT